MSQIVAAIGTVHAPFIVGTPQLAPPERRERVMLGFERLRRYLEERQPDVIWAFSSEHITNFLSSNVPAFCLGVGPTYPTFPEFRLPETEIPCDQELARAFLEYAYQAGCDLSYSTAMKLDHGTMMPLHFLEPDLKIPLVVLLQNAIWSPMPTAERCFQVGQLVRRFLDQDGLNRRVALLATGGISHWVGNRNHGSINIQFDQWFLDALVRSDVTALRNLTQSAIDEAGDGANEVRNWVMLLGAVPDRSPEVVCGETFIPGWNTSAFQVMWN